MSRLHSYKGTEINDGIDLVSVFDYSYSLPPSESITVQRTGKRPLIGGKRLPQYTLPTIGVQIVGDLETLRKQLYQLFDPDDDQAYPLIKTDDDGASNQRYLTVACDANDQVPGSGGRRYAVTAVANGDVRWRSVQNVQVAWNITATGQTLVVNNAGEDYAYPIFTFKPTVAKSSGNPYKVHLNLRWNSAETVTAYPVDVANGGLDTQIASTNFYSATGDDIRVLVNGVETDFWLSGINTATTKVWVNLNFLAKQEATISENLGASSITSIDVNEDIGDFPDSGALVIDNEVFIYSAKDTALKRFTIESRAAHGTTAASHTAGAACWWKQNDIVISYGSSGFSAYASDDDYKPAFDLASSTNTSWVYTEFNDSAGLRSGAWGYTGLENVTQYTSNHAGTASPYTDIGLASSVLSYSGRGMSGFWGIRVPTGITNANFTNGEKYSTNPTRFSAHIRSSIDGASYTQEYDIPAVSAASTWETWSQNIALTSGSKYVFMWITGVARYTTTHRLEVSDVTLTLNSSNTPTTWISPESGSYQLDITLINQTTGDSFSLNKDVVLNDEIEVNTDEDTVTYLADNSNQYHLLEQNGVRGAIMRLAKGDNTLQFSDDGTTGVTITIIFKKRFYV